MKSKTTIYLGVLKAYGNRKKKKHPDFSKPLKSYPSFEKSRLLEF